MRAAPSAVIYRFVPEESAERNYFFALAMIPLRPELVEFMDPRSLCRYACTSKTLCKDVSDLKAWDLLAKAQVPRSVRGPSALARVQSHVRRRRLADELWQDDPPQTFHPNGFGDFRTSCASRRMTVK